jgi:hypothetical protein
MTESEIIDRVYEQTIEQAARVLFGELMLTDINTTVRHENAERRFKYALTAAAFARDRAKVIKTDQGGRR